jgi:hypothetical protein
VRTVIDERSRVAYAEIRADEKEIRANVVLKRAVAGFADRDVGVERVLSGNGSAYRPRAWADASTALGTKPRYDPLLPTSDEREDGGTAPLAGIGYMHGSTDQRPNAATRSPVARLLPAPQDPLLHRNATQQQALGPAWAIGLGGARLCGRVTHREAAGKRADDSDAIVHR